jgi:hypothetical protein
VPDSLENNWYLVALGFVAAFAVWMLSASIRSWRIRRAARTSAVFLAVPIAYLGHPVLLYQSWMLPVAYVQSKAWLPLSFFGVIWSALVLLFQFRPRAGVK